MSCSCNEADARRSSQRRFSLNVVGYIWAVVTLAAFVSATEQSCGGTFREQRGEISSPNYPGRYPIRKICLYRIIRPVDGPMTLKFPEFNIDPPHFGTTCDYGFVKVYDGDSADNTPMIGNFCGTNAVTVHSTSSAATLVFYSYNWKPGYGFQMTYGDSETCESKGGSCRKESPCLHPSDAYCRNDAVCCMTEATCGGIYRKPDGLLKSPNFPGNYDTDLDCVYTIQHIRGQVALKFKEFDLEGGDGCAKDYVMAYDGPSVNSPAIGSKFCGRDWKNMVTSSQYLTLLFHSDSRVTKGGFQALWIGIQDSVPGCYFWDHECRVDNCNGMPDNRCPDKDRCCQEACNLALMKICPDGGCTSNNVSCDPNSPPLAPGGVQCPAHAHRCADNSCIFGEYDCGCTIHKPHRCDEGAHCYDDREKCDTHADCEDRTDEDDCADPAMTGVVWGVIVGVVVVIISCCVYCCCCRSKKKKTPATSGAGYQAANTTENTALTAPEPQPQPKPEAGAQPQPYAPGQPQPYVPGQPQPYAPGQPQPYVPGQPQPYMPGQPQPYMPGQPQPYMPGQPQPYAPGPPQPYPPPHPMGPGDVMPSYGAYPPMAAPSAPPSAPPGSFPEYPPPYDAVAWSNQPEEQPIEMLKKPLDESC